MSVSIFVLQIDTNWKPSDTKINLDYIQIFILYLVLNTLRLVYKNQIGKVLQDTNRSLF